jgi:dihydrodiol dehydrogenase / D-xylose 1-dehydrogenase (NADP)
MKKVKWGIIGSGKIAKRFANDLKLLSSAELVGVSSRDPEKYLRFSEEFKTTPYSKVTGLLNADVDVIYVATPHTSHKAHSLMAINAGKAVLCEKPFAMNLNESQEIIQRAKLKNVFVMEAMWTRFFPAIQEVVALVKSGRIGKIQKVSTSLGYHLDFNPNSRIFNPELGGGSLLDVGVYNLAFNRMLIDELPSKIESTITNCSTGVDESASWTLNYPSGVSAVGESSVVKALENEACILGSEGEIRIPKFWCPRQYTINGELKQFEFDGMGFQFEAEEVMNCLREGLKQSPLWSHQHTLDVMQILKGITN